MTLVKKNVQEMGASRENCKDRRQEPDNETAELLGLIEKYPVVILTILVSPHIQEYTHSDHKNTYTQPIFINKMYTMHEY